MREIIRRTRGILVNTPDTVCLERAQLATRGYRRFADDPLVIRRAKTFKHILDNMTLDLETNPIFAGNTSSRPRAWMLLPEYGFKVPNQAIIEHPEFRGFLDGDAVPEHLRTFWSDKSAGGDSGIGHLAVNLSRVLSEGLEGIIAEARSHTDTGSPAADYRKAMVIACRAVISWAHRYASEARKLAGSHADPEVRRALLRAADACERVPAKPARDLFEALQAVVLVHMAIAVEGHGYSVSTGLLDRVLLPYYRNDSDATEQLAAFMLKLSANSIWGSHSKTQAITLGGLDSRGQDACNTLTMRFLDACDMVRMPDPHVFLRWHEKMDRRVKERALELLGSGLSMPMLVGDEQTSLGLQYAGIPSEDARGFCVIGCNEIGIPGKLWDSTTGPCIIGAAILNEALMSVPADLIRDTSDLLSALRDKMKVHITRVLKGAMHGWDRAAKRVPTPFTSALMDGCAAMGADFHNSSQYRLPVLMERGFVNAVNGLAAIEQVVFRDRTLGHRELVDALEDDFADDSVRQRLLDAPKWGNDDDRADSWAVAWMRMREEVLREVEDELGDRRHVVQHVIRSLHHIDGAKLGATPDGRKAGAPTADSIGPTAGTATEGPTALLNSILKLDPSRYWQAGYNLNLTISQAMAADPYMRQNLLAMVEALFADGGQELQIGCLNAETLRDAKAHPEKYPHLLVRIAGFNALFTKLSPAEQDELIARAELSEQ